MELVSTANVAGAPGAGDFKSWAVGWLDTFNGITKTGCVVVCTLTPLSFPPPCCCDRFVLDDDELFVLDDDELFVLDDEELFVLDDDELFVLDEDEELFAFSPPSVS